MKVRFVIFTDKKILAEDRIYETKAEALKAISDLGYRPYQWVVDQGERLLVAKKLE